MSLGDYLPHGTAIVFIDEVLKFEEGRIKTKSLIKEDNKFLMAGDKVVIDAACSIQDASGFGVYDCELYVNGELGARATLNVLSPDEEYVKRILDE